MFRTASTTIARSATARNEDSGASLAISSRAFSRIAGSGEPRRIVARCIRYDATPGASSTALA